MALDLTTILGWLAPEKATWIDIKDPAQFSDGVARRWWNIPLESVDEVAQWLRFSTDAKNVTTSGTPPVTAAVITFKVSTPGGAAIERRAAHAGRQLARRRGGGGIWHAEPAGADPERRRPHRADAERGLGDGD
jgi:hypothetical protein